MNVVTTKTALWADQPNTLTVMRGCGAVPDPHTAAFAFIFSDSKLLVVDVRKRGWDIPGGHIENSETALDAVVRETREEAGLLLAADTFNVVGWTHLHVEAPKPIDYKYPYPHTYQLLYSATVPVPLDLTTEVTDEIGDVVWVDRDVAEQMLGDRDWWALLESVWP